MRTLQVSDFPKSEFLDISTEYYDGVGISKDGTDFLIFGKKKHGIGASRLSSAIEATWPLWTQFFSFQIPPITLIDTDWGLGGGSLGPFMIAVHLKGDYDEISANYLEAVLGWSQQKTGLDYVKESFKDFPDPLMAYVIDQVAHELGHIFFLHGITDLKKEEEIWFGLGLGMFYDRIVWSQLFEKPSPVFTSMHKTWKEKFDNYVRSYLSRPIGSTIEYADFLTLFDETDKMKTQSLETQFKIK